MAATDAITQTAIARREARASIERLEYHLARGPRGRKGVQREIAFLDALHRQSVRLSGRTIGSAYIGRARESFGAKAAAALASGNASTVGRMKSSLLADFSADGLQPVRDAAGRLGVWTWTANSTACPTCLDLHGRTFRGTFIPIHPSCLCIGQPVGTPGLRRLSDDELVDTAKTYGDPRYARQLEAFANGSISRNVLAGVEAVNRTARGYSAVIEHLQKAEVQQVALGSSAAQ